MTGNHDVNENSKLGRHHFQENNKLDKMAVFDFCFF